MRKINLHLTDYDRLGENRRTTSHIVNLAEVPSEKQYLLVDENGKNRPYFVTNTYIPVGHGDDTLTHVFATRTSAPYQEAEKVGISGDDLGMPSLTSFDGRTVSDLMGFLSQYPADMEVVFQDDQVLVARPKDVLILRLDPADDQ
ncbi:hypothetical protein FVE89_13815 [Methylobacterium sp. 2A]|uniref:hypothetical protein n=1 Tax=Methylobacterium sp. 2A TaxID=2603816 RepID=UPI001353FF1F|nr:hypothetical protein [Methylobacterium sp. 2A]MWV23052.1 hypothetical protein [Methylobacterium sp. 2A]